MGIVIPWPGKAPSGARANRSDASQPGEIILFLGVRYERDVERTAPVFDAPERAPDTPSPRATGGPTRERRRRRG